MTNDAARRAFVLGTVQIGMTYGAVNSLGRAADAGTLIDTAAGLGVGMLDTAQAYGNAEETLGTLLSGHGAPSFEIVSKIAPAVAATDSDAVLAAARESVRRLGRPLYGLMYHDSSAIRSWENGAGLGLKRARDTGLCGRIGVSVYTPEEAALALAKPEIDIVQFPFNMLDRRLAAGSALDDAMARGCEVHFRSLFLQGLLLTEPDEIPRRLAFARPWVAAVRETCRRHGISPGAGAIGYVRHRFPAARLVIGCDTSGQLRDNFALFEAQPPPDGFIAEIEDLALPPETVVNPALWPRAAA